MRLRTLLLCLLLGGFACSGRAQVNVGFTGAFAVGSWVFTSGGSGSTLTWNSGNTAFTLTGSQNHDNLGTTASFKVDSLPANYRISFDWSYTTGDPYGPVYDPAGYESIRYVTLSDDNGASAQSGTVSNAFASSFLEFHANSDNWSDPSDGTSALTISNFRFTLAPPGDTGEDGGEGGGGDEGGGSTPPAGTTLWEGGSGNWASSSHWNPGTPDLTLDAQITSNAAVAVTGTAQAASLILNSSTLNISGNGALAVSGDVTAESSSALTVSGPAASFSADHYYVFKSDTLVDNGATVTTNDARFGIGNGNAANVTIRNGSQWNSTDFFVGWNGSSTVNVESGGQLTVTDHTHVGYANGGTGTLNITGAGSHLEAHVLSVGSFGKGTLNLTGGATLTADSTAIAYGSSDGQAGQIQGTVNVTGAGSRLDTGTLGIGAFLSGSDFSVGSLTIANGGVVSVDDGSGWSAIELYRRSSLNIGTGGLSGTLLTDHIFFRGTNASQTTLAFNHTDNVTFAAVIGRLDSSEAQSLGQVTKAGSGTLTLTGDNYYAGNTVLSGGTLAAGHDNAFGISTVNLAGGTLSGAGGAHTLANNLTLTASSTIGGSSDLTFTGNFSSSGANRVLTVSNTGVTTFDGNFVIAENNQARTFTLNNSGRVVFNGVVAKGTGSGADSFTKNGAGTAVFENLASYTGTTTINAGTLALGAYGFLDSNAIVVGSGAAFDVSAVNGGFKLNAGQTLRGTGTIAGDFTLGQAAHLAPGNPTGTLTFTNGLALEDGAILDFSLGASSDLIRVSHGTLAGPNGGHVTINLANSGGFTANTYVLFNFAGAALEDLTLADFELGSEISGYHYTFALTATALQLIATSTAIPEPSTYTLIAGLATLALIARRRRGRTS